MATLKELRSLFNDSDLQEQVEAAIIIAAHNKRAGSPTAAEKAWAAYVFENPASEAKKALMGVIAEHSNLTVEQIRQATPTAIQNAVDGLADLLVDARAGV